MYRLLINLHHDGQVYPKGTELDPDTLGLDAKSMVAEKQAEAIRIGETVPDAGADALTARVSELEQENASLKQRLAASKPAAEDVKTMDRPPTATTRLGR